MSKNLKRRRIALAIYPDVIHLVLCNESHLILDKKTNEIKVINSTKKERDKILDESDSYVMVNVSANSETDVQYLELFQDIVTKFAQKVGQGLEQRAKELGRPLKTEDFAGVLEPISREFFHELLNPVPAVDAKG